jgi:hypothetical protein
MQSGQWHKSQESQEPFCIFQLGIAQEITSGGIFIERNS